MAIEKGSTITFLGFKGEKHEGKVLKITVDGTHAAVRALSSSAKRLDQITEGKLYMVQEDKNYPHPRFVCHLRGVPVGPRWGERWPEKTSA